MVPLLPKRFRRDDDAKRMFLTLKGGKPNALFLGVGSWVHPPNHRVDPQDRYHSKAHLDEGKVVGFPRRAQAPGCIRKQRVRDPLVRVAISYRGFDHAQAGRCIALQNVFQEFVL
ncbi:hypothetical protein SAMN05421850_11617 [Lutimaribacter saemankumensis]|uniref:Uncharacterized protein n=1 Tax=Lutimaribacter saemankumensis TaxID=490829 RepID=A0A1G8T452_9RHOB|nr:hypothetical protein SAMN05421850_11617 [Lutimaribacter saemankumensis]